jgi:hypothetical protein
LILIKLHPFNVIGIPDRLVLGKGGRLFFLELKTSRGKLSKRQAKWKERLENYGFTVKTTYGEAALLKALRDFVRVPEGGQ